MVLNTTRTYSIAQIVVDIVGDLMSKQLRSFSKRSLSQALVLYIPCRLIWKVKIRLARELALASCLCLTVVVMVCTVMRITGLSYYKSVDAVWETFWQYVSASVGLCLTSVAAFRSLFISHRVSHRQQETSDLERLSLLYDRVKRALKRNWSIQPLRVRAWQSRQEYASDTSNQFRGMDLGKVERGTITGLRTFIRQYQRSPDTPSRLMYSQTGMEVEDHEEVRMSPDSIFAMGVARNHKHDEIIGADRSGKHDKIPTFERHPRHERTLAHQGSRKFEKLLNIQESRKHDKMLNSQESRKHDKMLKRQENDEGDKVITKNGGEESDMIIARPKKIHSASSNHNQRSVTTTFDSDLNSSRIWSSGRGRGKITPKTRAGMMAKMKCGGFVFSAGLKAERYKEQQ